MHYGVNIHTLIMSYVFVSGVKFDYEKCQEDAESDCREKTFENGDMNENDVGEEAVKLGNEISTEKAGKLCFDCIQLLTM